MSSVAGDVHHSGNSRAGLRDAILFLVSSGLTPDIRHDGYFEPRSRASFFMLAAYFCYAVLHGDGEFLVGLGCSPRGCGLFRRAR